MDTRMGMAELLCCALETITTLLIGYTPIQNKKLKKIKAELFYVCMYVCMYVCVLGII